MTDTTEALAAQMDKAFTRPQQAPYLTREQIAEAAKAELGIPLTLSAINKAAADGRGPKPVARYGNAYLYEKAAALEWVRSLVTPLTA